MLAPVALSALIVLAVVGTTDTVSTVAVLSILAVPLVLSVWALLDIARRPAWVWALAGRSQPLWMAGVMLGAMVLVAGVFVSLRYLSAVRPELRRVEAGDLPPW